MLLTDDDPDYSAAGQADRHAGLDAIFNRQRYGVNDTSWIVASGDQGKTWDIEATDFHFFRGRLSSPRFINAGQGYKDAPKDLLPSVSNSRYYAQKIHRRLS